MDALYFRVSSERQTTENQFADLLQVAEKDGSGRDWNQIRDALSRCVIEEHRPGASGTSRTVYRVDAEVATELASVCVYVEQGRSGKIGARQPEVASLSRLGQNPQEEVGMVLLPAFCPNSNRFRMKVVKYGLDGFIRSPMYGCRDHGFGKIPQSF